MSHDRNETERRFTFTTNKRKAKFFLVALIQTRVDVRVFTEGKGILEDWSFDLPDTALVNGMMTAFLAGTGNRIGYTLGDTLPSEGTLLYPTKPLKVRE